MLGFDISGNVFGPPTTAGNVIARFDTTGTRLKADATSAPTISDVGIMRSPAGLGVGGLGIPSSVYDLGAQTITSLMDIRHTFTTLATDFTIGSLVFVNANPSSDAVNPFFALNIEARTAVGNAHNFAYVEGGDTAAYHLGSGLVSSLTGQTSTATSGNFYLGGGGGPVTLMQGGRHKATSYTASTVAEARGSADQISNDGPGIITLGYARWAQVNNTSTGTIVTGIAEYIAPPTNTGGGFFTNAYGLYIADQTLAGTTVNYQFFSASTTLHSRFGGPLEVGGDLVVGGITPIATGFPVGYTSGGKFLVVDGVGGSGDVGLMLRETASTEGLDLWYDYSAPDIFFDSRWNNPATSIHFRLRTLGTPVNILSLAATGVSTFGGTVALGANSLTLTGSIGATGARALKGWFTDLEVTNSIVGNVTGSAGTATLAAAATVLANARTIGGVSFNGSANITVASASGGFTVSGGALALGANDLTMTGSLGVTGSRLTKGWFSALESTAAPTVGGAAVYYSGGTDVTITDGGTGVSTIPALSVWVANALNTLVTVTPSASQSVRINAAGNAWEAFTPGSGLSGLTDLRLVVANGTTGAQTPFDAVYTAAYVGPGGTDPAHPSIVTTTAITANSTFTHTALGQQGIYSNVTYTPTSDATSGNMRGVFASVHATGTFKAYIISAVDAFASIDSGQGYTTVIGTTVVGTVAGASAGTGAIIGVVASGVQQHAGATVPLIISLSVDPTNGGSRTLLGTATTLYGARIVGMTTASMAAPPTTRAGLYFNTMGGTATNDWAILCDATQTSKFAGPLIATSYIGGTGTTSTVKIFPTTGVGTTGADIVFAGGTNGASEWGRFLHGGGLLVGVAGVAPGGTVSIAGATSGSGTIRVDSAAGTAVVTMPTTTGRMQAGLRTRVTGQGAANASICTLTVGGSDASYHVSMNMNVASATAIATTMTCTYTDENSNARTLILPVTQLSGSFIALGAVTGTGAWETPILHIRCKSGTAITLLTSAGTFTTVSYTAEGLITQV